MKDKIVYKNYSFTGNTLSSLDIGREKSLTISALGIDTLEAEVIADPAILKFQKNDSLYYYRGESKAGVYHVQSIERVSAEKYAISAISPLGLLADMDHYGGIYTGQTALEVIRGICGPVSVLVKSNLEAVKLYGWLPIAKARDNLSRVLFALGANLGTDSNGVLRVETLWGGYASYIPAERVYINGANVEQLDLVSSVTVLEHRYAPGTARKDLFEGTTIQGQRITWSDPMHSLTATGFSVLESGANYAVVSSGNGKLTGAEYIHNTIEVTRKVADTQVPNDIRIEDATLVSLTNSAAVADRLAAYYACRSQLNMGITLLRERPGEVVKIVDPYDRTMVNAAIASTDETVSSVSKASITALVGFTPPEAEDVSYADERFVLTGSGTWTPPENAVDVRAVLISGGQGGASGKMGKTSEPGKSSTGSLGSATLRQVSVGTGGDGGEAGQGGTGGKVFQVNISLEESASFPYQCGSGGTGGASNKDRTLAADEDVSAAGSDGTDTIFGTYSSASGASSPSGYYDPITKETFARAGSPGVAGGKGGSNKDEGQTIQNKQNPGPDLVYNGVTYHAGANNTNGVLVDDAIEGYNLYVEADYGAGGGAAAGANGLVSTSAPTASISNRGSFSSSAVYATGGAGGRGGDAIAPEPQIIYGTGGTGGNGGGGAGGAGFAGVESRRFPGNTNIKQQSSDNFRGLGSDGGAGGPGCIILYCRVAVKKRAGAVVDKSKRFLLDKSGRLLIV